MGKNRIIIGVVLAAILAVIILQIQTIGHLRRELANASETNHLLQAEASSLQENARKRSSVAGGADKGADVDRANDMEAKTRLQELESEVLRLRGAAARTIRAEAETAQLKLQLEHTRPSPAIGGSDYSSSSNAVTTYLGDAVQPPPNLPPAYTKDGLLNAIQDAARNAGITLKKVEIETTEFPFLCGIVCEQEADFEKLKNQFKQMDSYEYGGSVSSRTSFAFNLTPHRAYPPDSSQRISRRTMLRQQMFFDQLGSR